MLLKNKTDIESWLRRYGIKNYELIPDNEYGYVVNVNERVYLSNKNLKSIDVKFNIVHGDFNCSHNKLKSLFGCPEIVDGFFACNYNQLKTLQFMPNRINKYFYCINNKLNINGLLSLFENDKFVELKMNHIYLVGNKELNNLQFLNNYEELKKHLLIVKQKNDLIHYIKTNDKAVVEKLNKI